MGNLIVDILIESTIVFEQDLSGLEADMNVAVMESVNNYVRLFPDQKQFAYDGLKRLPLRSQLNGYESSLYVLKVSEKLSIILAVDEDPIFNQLIITLFRAVKYDKLNRAYQTVAESLYQELSCGDRGIVQPEITQAA